MLREEPADRMEIRPSAEAGRRALKLFGPAPSVGVESFGGISTVCAELGPFLDGILTLAAGCAALRRAAFRAELGAR